MILLVSWQMIVTGSCEEVNGGPAWTLGPFILLHSLRLEHDWRNVPLLPFQVREDQLFLHVHGNQCPVELYGQWLGNLGIELKSPGELQSLVERLYFWETNLIQWWYLLYLKWLLYLIFIFCKSQNFFAWPIEHPDFRII